MTSYMQELLARIESASEEMVRLRTEPEAEQVIVEVSGDHFWLEKRSAHALAQEQMPAAEPAGT